MRNFNIFLVCVCWVTQLPAQLSGYDLYLYDLKWLTPAFSGIENIQNYNFQIRRQLNIGELNNSTIALSFEDQLSSINSGIGFIVNNRILGSTFTIENRIDYNYQFHLSEVTMLVLGIGLDQTHIFRVNDLSSLPDDGDPLFNGTTNNNYYVMDLDGGIGLISDRLTVGFGAFRLFESEKNSESIFFPGRRSRYYNAFAGYEIVVNSWLSLSPSVRYLNYSQYQTTFHRTELNIVADLAGYVFIGSTYRFSGSDQLIVHGGLSLPGWFQIMAVYTSRDIEESPVSTTPTVFHILVKIMMKN